MAAQTFPRRGGWRTSIQRRDNSTQSSPRAPGVLLIVQPQPVHPIIVLWISHDGVDVIWLLNSEFDDQPRSMNPIIERTSKVIRRTPPREVQLVEARSLDSIKVPLGRVMIGIAHILFHQRKQQFLLRRIELAGRKALEAAEAVTSADTCEYVGENRLSRQHSDLRLLRVQRADEIETAQPFVAEHDKAGIRTGYILQRLSTEKQGSGLNSAVGTGKRCTEMMTGQQPGPGFAGRWLTEDRYPIVGRWLRRTEA